MNKIKAYIPIANTGYSKHALLLLKQFILKNECQLIPIGNIEIPECFLHDHLFLNKIQECLNTTINTNISFKFWHEFDLIINDDSEVKIGFTTFEVDNINLQTNCNSILTASSWGKNVLLQTLRNDRSIIYKNKLWKQSADYIFGKLPLENKPYYEYPAEFLHIGKYELRKQTEHLIYSFIKASQFSNSLTLNLVCHNPFHNLSIEMFLLRLGFRDNLGSFIRNNLIINIYPYYVKENVLDLLKRKCIQIYPGGSEGANLSLLESLNYYFREEDGSHSFYEPIYCPTTAHADLNLYLKNSRDCVIESIPAYDGIFFKDPHTKNLFYRLEQDCLVNKIVSPPITTSCQNVQLETIDNLFYKWINEEKWEKDYYDAQ